jgi:uncharacterized protein (DUF1330 family)
MSAYLVVDTKITDPETYEDYKAQVKPLIERYGGIYRARGGEIELIDGDLWSPTRLVIIEFPDMATARAWAASDEYQPIKAIRHASSDCTVLLVDGLE